ncbi:hypothetical protein NNC19_05825 [Clostridium sp. SHJSY1]|uniref:hypothetical protein n=1 Tax=Clostridium sp. SHJSY1 TaxID=2942483 RepID=UPI0028757EBE|nr:hypothetical protein [Clostridium sp. SHJSY1]MDS0525193.1 hypothetical protein [Clostridium sp. SHJSY1]
MRERSKTVFMISGIVLFAVFGYCFRDTTNSICSEKISNSELLNLDSGEKSIDTSITPYVLNSKVKSDGFLTKNEALTEIFRNEINTESIPKYFIPVKAIDGNVDNLKKVEESNAFLCNDNNKLDNGILIELPEFNENNKTDNFIVKDYNSIKVGGEGDIDRGTISNTGNVEFLR